jgi:predicted alpha/beta hydrolase
VLTPIKTWTIQRNWQHWVKHTRYLNTNQNMDNPEKIATKHTQDDMLTPIKTWTIQRNWQHWVKHTQDDILTPIIAYV